MASVLSSFYREWTHALLGLILLYYTVMDIVLYVTLQSKSLTKEANTWDHETNMFQIFHPLSVQDIMLDQTNHYVIKPLAQTFNHVTNIHKIVTCDVITAIHVIMNFVIGKCILADNLHQRRIGVLLYEVRTFLVCLAGLVYQSGQNRQGHLKGIYGTTANAIFDVTGGLLFCMAVCASIVRQFNRETLPGGTNNNNHSVIPRNKLVVCLFAVYSLVIIGTVSFVAYFNIHLEKFFEKTFPDPQLTKTQTTLLHSTMTWVCLWTWRLVTHQLFQYLAIAVFLDTIWEYMSRCLYLLIPVVVVLMSLCYTYIVHMNSIILGGEYSV